MGGRVSGREGEGKRKGEKGRDDQTLVFIERTASEFRSKNFSFPIHFTRRSVWFLSRNSCEFFTPWTSLEKG